MGTNPYIIDDIKERLLTGEIDTIKGMLTGARIEEEVQNRRIVIDDYSPLRLNPNSYNLRIADTLIVYKKHLFKPLDAHSKILPEDCKTIPIPEDGLVLKPNRLYIGSTIEKAGSDFYIPMLNGRSSTGRLGMSIHITAGFGDIGFKSTWTLEITVVEPLRIYPNDEVCQICFFTPAGDIKYKYKGRYAHQEGPTVSKFADKKKEESYYKVKEGE